MRASDVAAVPIDVQVTGETTPNIAAYTEDRVRSALRFAPGRVLYARARIVRHPDPAVARPVTAKVNVDVDGRVVRAHVAGVTAPEAVDLLHDRLRQRLQHHLRRAAGHWDDRRGGRPAGEPHEWRHGEEADHRPAFFPRRPEDRQVIRHKSYTLEPCDVDEAAFDMEALDLDFHLFTEVGSGQDSVLYREGSARHRLAQVDPRPQALARHALPLTVSDQPAHLLSTPEAVERMAIWERPFLFFLDGERGRGAVLYHRYDGHYGLITPAA
jgi:hypothetical protein